MRKDLAHARVTVAGYDSIDEPDTGVGITWLNHRDLVGAVQLPDRCTDCPEYNYNRIRLADGRVFFMHGMWGCNINCIDICGHEFFITSIGE